MSPVKSGSPSFFGLGRKQRRFSDRLAPATDCIGPGVVLTGDLEGSGNFVIRGEVRGDGDIDGGLIIETGGHWTGNVRAHRIVIAGEVDGDVTAFEHLELSATARVSGNLTSPVIAIADGAQCDGKVRTPRKSQITNFTDRRAPRAP